MVCIYQGRSQGVPGGPRFESKCCFRFLGLILAELCLKCIILVTNFQKSPSAEANRPRRALIFNIGDLQLRDLTKR